MKNDQYFKHDAGASGNQKIMRLIDELGMKGYGAYWLLQETLRMQKNYRAPMDTLKRVARRARVMPAFLLHVIRDYDLFVIQAGCFYSPGMLRRMRAYDAKTLPTCRDEEPPAMPESLVISEQPVTNARVIREEKKKEEGEGTPVSTWESENDNPHPLPSLLGIGIGGFEIRRDKDSTERCRIGHPEPSSLCHPGPSSLCHPGPSSLCHPEPFSLCHPERSEGSPLWESCIDAAFGEQSWLEVVSMHSGLGLQLIGQLPVIKDFFKRHVRTYGKEDSVLSVSDAKSYFGNFVRQGSPTCAALLAELVKVERRTEAGDLYRYEDADPQTGARSYCGGQPIPEDAPPRPDAFAVWDEGRGQWGK